MSTSDHQKDREWLRSIIAEIRATPFRAGDWTRQYAEVAERLMDNNDAAIASAEEARASLAQEREHHDFTTRAKDRAMTDWSRAVVERDEARAERARITDDAVKSNLRHRDAEEMAIAERDAAIRERDTLDAQLTGARAANADLRAERDEARKYARDLLAAMTPDDDLGERILSAMYMGRPIREHLAEAALLREALTSIANNSCCGPCREARLVARAALAPAADAPPKTPLSANDRGTLIVHVATGERWEWDGARWKKLAAAAAEQPEGA